MIRVINIAMIACVLVTATARANDHLDSLLEKRQYFQIRKELSVLKPADLPVHRRLFYEALTDNFFHECHRSNQKIESLIKQYGKLFTDKEMATLLGKKIDNHVKLYEYREAFATSDWVLGRYSTTLSVEELKDVRNSAIIWKGLKDVPAQETVVSRNTRIAFKRDMAKLINVPVSFKDSTYDFVFDTGANLSVITDSYAKKTGMDLLDVYFDVRAITGIEVKARLGVARELKLDAITIRNVVFIVFPDSALSFGGGVYKINGILGFPVIEQLNEVHIEKAGFITVPQNPVKKTIRNFGMDELTPVINIPTNQDTLAFTFDTGAMQTDLYYPFYTRYQAMVESTGKAYEMKQGGAGGYTTYKAWRLPATVFRAGDRSITLPQLGVKTTHGDSKDKFYYGNLGQDLMSQFRELVISFRYMYVDFLD